MSTSIPTSIPIARPVNRYQTYHAHVYFDEATRERATRICMDAAALHGVQMGRVTRQKVLKNGTLSEADTASKSLSSALSAVTAVKCPVV